jgi:transporter family protein
MFLAVSLAILASLLWAITNHIDKFLVSGIDEAGKSIKTLMIFSTLVAGVVLLPIWLIASMFQGWISVNWFSLIMILLSAVASALAIYFYFRALDQNDTSVVVIMFQMIPVFTYLLALMFFHETLSMPQLVGAAIIMLSAILVSWDFGAKKGNKNRIRALILMMLSSLCYAGYYVLFNAATKESSYESCAFCYQIGLILIGMVLLGCKSYRETFLMAIKNNGNKYISINIANEVINLVAVFLINFSATIIPVALASILNGFQGAFVFVLGVLGMRFLPKYFKEDLSRKMVLQKVTCILLSIAGLVVMFI